MTSSISLKKFVSIGAALLLAVGGSLVSAAPASATVYSAASIDSSGTSVGGNSISVSIAGCPFGQTANTLTSQQISDFTVLVAGSSITPSSARAQNSYLTVTLPSPLPAGALVSVAYAAANGAINCSNGTDTVGSFTAVTLQLESAPVLTVDSPSAMVTSTSATLNFISDKSVSFVWTIRLASAGAPANFTNRYTWSAGAGDLQTSTGNAVMLLPKSVTVTGLSGSTAYRAYILGATVHGVTSNVLEIPFTTQAPQNQNVNQNAPTQLVAPTIVVSGSNAVVTAGTYSSGTVEPNWEYCDTAKAAVTVATNNYSNDCGPIFLAAGISSYVNVAKDLTLDMTREYYAMPVGSQGNTVVSISLTGKFVRYSEWVNSSVFSTATVPFGGSSVAPTDSTDVVDVPITEDMRPLPVWASNIVASIPTLTKSLVTTGGSVSLTGGDYADLKSVTIGGKAVAFKIETTGNVSIPVPAGEAGKTADIVVVFGGGVLTVQDAIKYVAPFNVAKIGERPIAIGAGAKKITEAVADQIRQAAFANMNNNTISCVAYAANNTAAAKAAAKSTAVQACGIATKANPGLKAADITVIVNKTKAKKEAVGIKVYKADN